MLQVRESKYLLNFTAELCYLLSPVLGCKALIKAGWWEEQDTTLLFDLDFMLLTVFHFKNNTLKPLPSVSVASHLLPSFFIPFKVSCLHLQQQRFPHAILTSVRHYPELSSALMSSQDHSDY